MAESPGPLPRWFKRDWSAAFHGFARLAADPQDTAAVFAIIRALQGRSVARGYDRLLKTAGGGRIAYERAELALRMSDADWMSQWPDDSVAAAYLRFTRQQGLSAKGLIRRSRAGLDAQRNDIPHPYAWFGRRVRDTHDVWHVLTGYGRDTLGESCLVAFSYGQTGGLGWAFIAVGIALWAKPRPGVPCRRALWEGYRRGRKAAWLLGEDYKALLAESLDAARARLNVGAGRVYDSISPPQRVIPARRIRHSLRRRA